ncbi:MAG: hypothetical protein QXP36_01925 [Conexivisphaerales archaeon]
MKVIFVDGKPYFYRPESTEEEKEMLMSLLNSIREHKLKIPKTYIQLVGKLTKLAEKDIKEALNIVRSDPTLQALCTSIYASKHPSYNPDKVREVDAEDELNPDVLAQIKQQIKVFSVKPLKRSNK